MWMCVLASSCWNKQVRLWKKTSSGWQHMLLQNLHVPFSIRSQHPWFLKQSDVWVWTITLKLNQDTVICSQSTCLNAGNRCLWVFLILPGLLSPHPNLNVAGIKFRMGLWKTNKFISYNIKRLCAVLNWKPIKMICKSMHSVFIHVLHNVTTSLWNWGCTMDHRSKSEFPLNPSAWPDDEASVWRHTTMEAPMEG